MKFWRRREPGEEAPLLAEFLQRFRVESYADLRERVLAKHIEVATRTAPSGREYEIEVTFHWDGAREGDIRVGGIIDPAGQHHILFIPWRPLWTYDFIMAPDGRFVGE